MRQLALTLSAIGLCAACAPFEQLPPPDPVWAAVVGPRNPFVIDGRYPDPFPKASAYQERATDRARTFIARLLPSSDKVFLDQMKGLKFDCYVYGGGVGVECDYSEARPPEPCLPSLRVSIEADIPYRDGPFTVVDKDVDVTALISPDREVHDDRGCFPM